MRPNQLYQKGYVPFHQSLLSAGYKLYIKAHCLKFLEFAIQDDYMSLQLIKKIIGLRAIPRPTEGGYQHKQNHKSFRVTMKGMLVDYEIESGCLLINDVTYDLNARSSHELPGLHVVQKDGETWGITKKYVANVTTEYAAVNGQSNNREQASDKIMPPQLLNAYGKEITKFTLFHNPTEGGGWDTWESIRDKNGLTDSMTKSFARVLERTQASGQSVKWVAHSQGGAIFAEGVRYSNKTVGKSLDKHTVCFQGMANNRLRTHFILKKAGVKLHTHRNGYNANPLDAIPQVIGLNALTDVMLDRNIKSVGRLCMAPVALFYGLPAAMVGGPNISPHTKPYESLPAYGKQVASGVKNTLTGMIKRFL